MLHLIAKLYRNEPALCNAFLVLVGVLIQHFTLSYGTDIKVAVDGLLVTLGAIATRQEVTPVAKLNNSVPADNILENV